MKKTLLSLGFISLGILPQQTFAFSFGDITQMAVSQVQQQITSSFTGAFSNLASEAGGALSNPGSILTNYQAGPAIEEQIETTQTAVETSPAFNPEQIRENAINTADYRDANVAEGYQSELFRVKRRIDPFANLEVLSNQHGNINEEAVQKERTDLTTEINKTMDNILKLTDKICSYQSASILCFPSGGGGEQ